MNGASDFRCRSRYRHRSAIGGAAASLIIILVGVAMLMENLGIMRARDIWDWAPAVLIVLGVLRIVDSGGRPGAVIFGTLMAGAGAIWLSDNLGFLRFDPRLMWPFFIIAAGVLLLVRNLTRSATPGPARVEVQGGFSTGANTEGESTIFQWAFFGGTNRRISTQDFRGGEAMSIFGGINLDLRQAQIKGNKAVLDCTAVFGGVDLKVPEDWVVVLKGNAIFGAFEEKTVHPPQGPELEITGVALFGGVSVRN